MQAQERWDDFTSVKYEMLKRTHSASAPWTVIRSMDKHLCRLNAMKVILNSVHYEKHDQDLNIVPGEKVVFSGAREIEIMERQRLKNGKFIG